MEPGAILFMLLGCTVASVIVVAFYLHIRRQMRLRELDLERKALEEERNRAHSDIAKMRTAAAEETQKDRDNAKKEIAKWTRDAEDSLAVRTAAFEETQMKALAAFESEKKTATEEVAKWTHNAEENIATRAAVFEEARGKVLAAFAGPQSVLDIDATSATDQHPHRETFTADSAAANASHLEKLRKDLDLWIRAFQVKKARALAEMGQLKAALETEQQELSTIWQQKAAGFPWLAEAYADYYSLREKKVAEFLETKPHPAPAAAEQVRFMSLCHRAVAKELRVARYLLMYWRSLFPFLEDFLGDVEEDDLRAILEQKLHEQVSDESDLQVDPVRLLLRNRLTDEEYQRLTPAERNQRALDWYWIKPKTKWQVGKDYERYVGYVYEQQGWKVYYQGILEGYDDLGRDLVAKRDNETLIVQCKRWSAEKQIRENHVNQLFGTTVKYEIENPGEKVRAVLCTTTRLSEKAKEFARHLGVEVWEKFEFKRYPCIKCNVSRLDGQLIYHLPFDQLYDRTIIETDRGERYVMTVAEAERLRFRRAWKWHGLGAE